jgi:Carboxypeptidase regulatory-like domain
VLLGRGTGLGQATTQIHGTVQDSSGAAVAAATVKATQTETGVSRSVTSEADGGFVLTSLPLGPYNVEVVKEGFATAVQSGVVLQVNSDLALSISLKVGGVTERVAVEANATQVETRSAGVGTVIENQRILELPLNGRQGTDLITLSGLAVQTEPPLDTT